MNVNESQIRGVKNHLIYNYAIGAACVWGCGPLDKKQRAARLQLKHAGCDCGSAEPAWAAKAAPTPL